MKCPSCGEENKDGSKFCKHCGATLNVNAAPAVDSQPKDSKNTLIICATAIICVIIIAAAFVFLNSSGNSETAVNDAMAQAPNETVNETVDETADTSSSTTVKKDKVDSMTYSEASAYMSQSSGTIVQNTFDEADKNGDGLLTGSEITEFKRLADLTARTADNSNTEHVEAQDFGAGDGSTKTRYCTTHGRVAVGSDNLCPYCKEEGLDARTVKGSTEYI